MKSRDHLIASVCIALLVLVGAVGCVGGPRAATGLAEASETASASAPESPSDEPVGEATVKVEPPATSPQLDIDGDGIVDWQDADRDNDGYHNQAEKRAGSDPDNYFDTPE